MSRLVIAAVSDLFFASKIRATAEHLGIEVRFVRNSRTLADISRENPPDLVLVDLQSTNLDPMELAQTLRTDEQLHSVPLLGFYSHIQTELQEQALQAGYTRVMPRSAFSQKLGDVLSGVI